MMAFCQVLSFLSPSIAHERALKQGYYFKFNGKKKKDANQNILLVIQNSSPDLLSHSFMFPGNYFQVRPTYEGSFAILGTGRLAYSTSLVQNGHVPVMTSTASSLVWRPLTLPCRVTVQGVPTLRPRISTEHR